MPVLTPQQGAYLNKFIDDSLVRLQKIQDPVQRKTLSDSITSVPQGIIQKLQAQQQARQQAEAQRALMSSYSSINSGGGGGSYVGPQAAPRYTNDPDLNWILQRESGGRTTAKNPTSTAFGLGQLLDYNRASYARKLGITNPNTTDFDQQLAMMKQYIKERYGTSANAVRFWQAHHWY